MISDTYRAQVDLLLRIVPHVAKEKSLALKGGTAINLFVRNMPRFSVDIDLTYLPFDARDKALSRISVALNRIKASVEKSIPSLVATILPEGEGEEVKLVCRLKQATVKIEINKVIRGHLWPTRDMQLTQAAQDAFEKFAEIQVVSHAELYGGKICAALDRQHPRDLFDVHQLFAHEGMSDEIRLGFIAFLLSHPRPLHETLRPHFLDRRKEFKTEFAGMALEPFSYEDLEATRERLQRELTALLTRDDREFLLSFKRGEPDWKLFPMADLQHLPAIKWKLANIGELRKNPKKHAMQLRALEKALSS